MRGRLKHFCRPIILTFFFTSLVTQAWAGKSRCSEFTKRIANRRWIDEQNRRVAKQLDTNPSMALGYSNIQKFGYQKATVNPEVIKQHSSGYTHEIPVKFIENQENSGRCWIFSCNRVVELDSGDNIKLSAVYPYFWHLFLQADRYLMDVAKLKPDEDSGTFESYPEPAVADGGLDEQFFSIARFAGMVPEYAMPENASSQKTGDVTRQLNNYLARIASALLNAKTEMIRQGAKPIDIAQTLRDLREKGMAQIYQIILVKNLGAPPLKIEYRKRLGAAKIGKLKRAKFKTSEFTPHAFMKNVLKVNPDDWVIVGRHPNRPAGHLYQEANSEEYPTTFRDREGIFPAQILNVTIGDLLEVVEASIREGVPVRFAADIEDDVDHGSGIMHPRIHRNFTDLPPSEAFADLDVREAMKFGVGDANHAMMISGYDKPDLKTNPIKYKVVNSWGDKTGDSGFYHMYRAWAEEHLFSVIVPKHTLPPRIRALLRRKPIILDDSFWDRDPHEEDEEFENGD